MTVAEDRRPTAGPGEGGRPGPPPQGGRPADHRPDHLDRQHGRCPGCCTWRSSAAPSRTPRSPASTSARRSRRPASSPSSPAATSPRSRARIPCAWPVTPDMVNPGHPSIAVDEVNHVGEAVAVDRRPQQGRRAGRRRARRRRLRPAARRCWTWRRRSQDGATSCHDHLASNTSFHFVFDAGEAGTGRGHRPGVRRRRGRRQPAVRPAAADPGVHGAALGRRPAAGRQLHDVVLDPDPAHPAGDAGDGHRHPRAQAAGHRPRRRRRLRRQAAGHARRRSSRLLVARRLGKPVKWTETRSESLMTRPPRPRPDPVHRHRRRPRGQRQGPEGAGILADMGAYLRLVSPGVPVLGAFMFLGIYKFPAYRFECDGVFTNKVPTDAYRGAGRPEATFADRADHGRARRRAGHGPAGAAPQELDQGRGVPVHHGGRARVRQRRLRRGHPAGAASCSATTSCAPSSSAAASRTTRCSWASASPPSPRCAGWRPPGCSARSSYGAGGWEHASIRMLPTGKVEVVTGSTPHGQGHETAWSQLVADELGVPFEDVEVLHGDTAISSRGPGHLRLPVAGRRRRRGGQGRGEGGRQGPQGRRAPAGGQRGRPGVRRRHVLRARARPGTGHRRIQEIALATFAAHNFPEGVEPSIDADATFDPENFSFPHGTHICAMEVDTETGHGEDPQVRLRRRRRQRSSTR